MSHFHKKINKEQLFKYVKQEKIKVHNDLKSSVPMCSTNIDRSSIFEDLLRLSEDFDEPPYHYFIRKLEEEIVSHGYVLDWKMDWSYDSLQWRKSY